MKISSVGIDPGVHGAVSIIFEDDSVEIFDTPCIVMAKGKSTKNEYSFQGMAEILRAISAMDSKAKVFIEKVGAMPGNGGVSMFNFGKGYGAWLMACACFKLSYTLVTPQSWKKEMMKGMGDKAAAIIRVQELFPNYLHYFSLKKHVDRADSLLLAEYGRRSLCH